MPNLEQSLEVKCIALTAVKGITCIHFMLHSAEQQCSPTHSCASELPIKSEIICNWEKKSWVGLSRSRGTVGDSLAAASIRHPAVVKELLLRRPPPRPGLLHITTLACVLCDCHHHVSPTCGRCGKHSEAKGGYPPCPFRTTAELLK